MYEDLCCELMVNFRYINGMEVYACVAVDEDYYYLWFEPHWLNDEWFTEEDVDALTKELEEFGVRRFVSLDELNSAIKKSCQYETDAPDLLMMHLLDM